MHLARYFYIAVSSLKIYQSVDNYDAFCTILEKNNLSKTVQKNILRHFGHNEEKKMCIRDRQVGEHIEQGSCLGL